MSSIKRVLWVVFFFSVVCLHAAQLSSDLDRVVDYLAAKVNLSDVQPFIVAIGGCPGVGKSTLADLLVSQFAKKSISGAVLHIDDFNLPADERKSGVWNLSYLYLDELSRVIKEIVAGQKFIKKPTYDQITGKCDQEILDLSSTRILFFEGLYATCNHGDVNFLPYSSESIFVIADESDIYQWKKERNERRKKPRNEVEFKAHMAAMLHEYETNIAYSKERASIVLSKDSSHKISLLTIDKSE